MDLARLSLLVATFCCDFPTLRPLYHNFKKSLLRAHSQRNQLQFLRWCKEEMVLPDCCLPTRLRNLDGSPFPEVERMLLNHMIKKKEEEVRKLFRISAKDKTILRNSVTSEWWKTLCDFVYGLLRRNISQQKEKLKKKIEKLFEKSMWTKNSNPDLYVNLSSYNLKKHEKLVLGYGLNFAFAETKVNTLAINKGFVNLEKMCDNLSGSDINIARGCAYSLCYSDNRANIPKCFILALKNLKKNSDIHITKADKSNMIVILDKHVYAQKLNNLLSDEETYEKLRKNPTENTNRCFNTKLKSILKNTPDLIKKFTMINPTLPYMYGLVKTHKQEMPLRPIISSVGSVSYKLSKWLSHLLSPLVGTISDSNIKNSVELIDKIKDCSGDFILISFDVNSLFTKVPVKDVLNFLKNDVHRLNLPIESDVFIKLIELCVCNNVFTVGDEFYKQTFGLAMGNPLSPVLSNLYMEYFETCFLPKICNFTLPWFRYVDDILCLWPSNKNAHLFLDQLNNLVPSISFKIEEECNNMLPFLDTMIIKEDSRLKFKVYRKPTLVDAYIHNFSNHHIKVKEATFMGMFLRALRICDPEYINEEFNHIYNLARNLCYSSEIIDKCLTKANNTFYGNKTKEPFSKKNILSLPYKKELEPLTKILKNLNINVVFHYDNTIKSSLIKNSPVTASGNVYSIPCKECHDVYIGQTGKTLDERIKQHKYSVRTAQDSSAIFKHIETKNHCINWKSAKTIYKSSSCVDRLIVEAALIKSNNTMNLNDGLYKIDDIMLKLLLEDNNIIKANRICSEN